MEILFYVLLALVAFAVVVGLALSIKRLLRGPGKRRRLEDDSTYVTSYDPGWIGGGSDSSGVNSESSFGANSHSSFGDSFGGGDAGGGGSGGDFGGDSGGGDGGGGGGGDGGGGGGGD